MQNPYAMERFVQEHNAHARAVAELQALRRQAVAARRREMLSGWLARLERRFARSAGVDSRRASVSGSGPTEIPLAQARR
jgi:hypothetical protein